MKAILDFRGCVLHALHSNTDPDADRTEDGKPLPTVGYGLQNFIEYYILKPLETARLNEIIAVYDRGNRYRTTLFPGYKDRPAVDQELKLRRQEAQAAVTELLNAMGIFQASCPDTEADDVIAYLVENLPDGKIIYSTDQDLIQLASDTCLVTLKHEFFDTYPLYNSASPRQLVANIQPRHVALMKSLCGDKSDTYKGISGFGPTRFVHLLETFHEDGLDELCEIVATENFDYLGQVVNATNDPVLTQIYENRYEWRQSWLLAKLHSELINKRYGDTFNRFELIKRVPNKEELRAVLNRHACGHLFDRLAGYMPQQVLITADNLKLYPIHWFKEQFRKSPLVALDWETSDQLRHPDFVKAVKGREFVDMISSTITGSGLTFGNDLQYTVYISYDHADTPNVPREFMLELLSAIPDDVPVAIQNTNFEINVLKTSMGGYSIANAYDTRAMASYVDENLLTGLKERSHIHLGYDQIKYTDVIEKGKRMSDYSASHVFKYGADDPLVTAHLFEYYKLIMQLEGTWDFCKEHEFLPIEVASDGFIAGVDIDWELLDKQRLEDEQTILESTTRLRTLIKENQTPETIESATKRLAKELSDVVEAKTRQTVMQSLMDDDTIGLALDPAYVPKTDTQKQEIVAAEVEDVLEQFEEKVRAGITYEDYTEEEVQVECELTYTCTIKILSKLGYAESFNAWLTSLGVKKDAVFKPKNTYLGAWIDEVPRKDPSNPDPDLFDKMLLALNYNKTGKAKDGRSHPAYQEFKNYAVKYLDKVIVKSGSELNLNSPLQMVYLLYGMLDLPVRLRSFEVSQTRSNLDLGVGSVQADEDAILTALSEDVSETPWKREALESLLKIRKCQTRLGLFYNVYPLWKHPYTGMIHPQINMCGAETRRPTGSSPNPLQWPKRGEGKKFRKCIKPNSILGHDLIVSIDWSQQELRVAAALSLDEALLDCYIGSDVNHVISDYVRETLGPERMAKFLATPTKDVHTQTACGSLKLPYDAVVDALADETNEWHYAAKTARDAAKPTNFGGTYGIGAGKLARDLMKPVEEAKQFLADKKALYFGFEAWRESVQNRIFQTGHTRTVLGNIRHFYDELEQSAGDDKKLSSIYRQGVNYEIQGVCADNLKIVLSEIFRAGILRRTGAVLVAPIYDEVVFSVHHSQAVDLIMSVHQIMTRDIPGLPVPMLAEPSLGVNFADQIEIGRFPNPEAIENAVRKALRRLCLDLVSGHLFESYTAGIGDSVLDVTGIESYEQMFAAHGQRSAA